MTHGRDDAPVVVVEKSNGGVGAFLLGLLLGAGAALLLAPHSGEETRRVIRERSRRLRETVGERAEELGDRVEEGYERAKARLEEGFDTARRTIDEKRTGARDALDAGKAAVHSAREELDRRLAKSRAARGKMAATEETDTE